EGWGILCRTAENPAGFIGPDGEVLLRIEMPRSEMSQPLGVGKLGVALAQLYFGVARATAFSRVAQFALDGGNEARQVAFDEIVIGAGLHGFDRRFLSHFSRDENEG